MALHRTTQFDQNRIEHVFVTPHLPYSYRAILRLEVNAYFTDRIRTMCRKCKKKFKSSIRNCKKKKNQRGHELNQQVLTAKLDDKYNRTIVFYLFGRATVDAEIATGLHLTPAAAFIPPISEFTLRN